MDLFYAALTYSSFLIFSPKLRLRSPPSGFMTYVAEPLFAEWARFSDTRLSQTMLGHMGLNKASWGGLQQEQTSVSEEAEPSTAGTDAEDAAAAAQRDGNAAAAAGGTSSKEIPQGSRES